jgi:hypothetical protein
MHKLIFFILCLVSTNVAAQTWNSNAGGYNTGYGTVYGSFGLAMATQNIYNTTQMNLQRLTARQAMIKKWGLAAVEKAEREAKSGKTATTKSTSSGPVAQAPLPAPKYYGKFRPDASDTTFQKIADAVGETPEEKQLLLRITSATKESFEKEVATKGWKNNVAAAMTLFLVSNSTVFNDAAEPDDATVTALYESVNQSIDSIPEFASASNKDKQSLYNLLIGFSSIPLATYMEGKENGNKETVAVAAKLAGEMIKIVLKTDPEKIKF